MLKQKIIVMAGTIALAGCLGLMGCSSEESAAPAEGDGQAEAASETETAQTEEEAPASDYEVTIDDATVSEDYEGNPAVVVTYSWVNNSDEAMSAAAALSFQCFQNGVQLDTAIMDEDIDANGYMAEVKPGAGTSFGVAYALDDESDVSVEVSELISFDDTILAEKTFSVA